MATLHAGSNDALFGKIRRYFGLLVALVAFSTASQAAVISGDDLFLAPTLVPTAFYSPLILSSGDSHIFSAFDVPGATELDAVRILPLLNPNPATADGSYSKSDLAGITVANYLSYFSVLPNVDYAATQIAAAASTVTFSASGSYFVQLVTSNGAMQTTSLVHVEVDDSFLDPDNGNKAGVGRVLPDPDTDLTIISKDPTDNGALKNAMARFPTAPTASNCADVLKALDDYFKAHGSKKFSVTFIGHGNEGEINMGSCRITNDGRGGSVKAADFQKKIDKYVKRILFYSCKTFGGTDGDDFWKKFHDSIKGDGTVGGWHDSITSGTTEFDANAGAKLSTDESVPEPGTLLLMLAALAGWTARARRRKSALPV